MGRLILFSKVDIFLDVKHLKTNIDFSPIMCYYILVRRGERKKQKEVKHNVQVRNGNRRP